MSIVENKLKQNIEEKEYIEQKIAQSHIDPTKEEQKKVEEVIKRLSARFSEELLNNDPDDIGDELRKAITEECSNLNISY